MPPAKTKPAAWLDLLIAKGPALREAGILSIDLDGCAVTLAPVALQPQQWIPAPTKGHGDMGDMVDALNDPQTFGTEHTPGFYDGNRQGPGSEIGMSGDSDE